MSLMRINRRSYERLVNVFRDVKRHNSVIANAPASTSAEEGEPEYSETPQYPEIFDLSLMARAERRREILHNDIKRLNTVEEKLMKINMPKYYGWKSLLLTEKHVPYNSLSLAQFVTRTHIVKEQGLPKYYDRILSSDKIDASVQQVKKRIEDAIVFEHISHRREHELHPEVEESPKIMSNIIGDAIARQINRILLSTLSSEIPHLLEAQVDHSPRVEAFWFAGGLDPLPHVRRFRKRTWWLRKYVNMYMDRQIQYKGDPILQIRHDLPLKEILSLSESENTAFEVPIFRFDPRTLGYTFKEVHGTSIPGYWPGDPSEFGLLSYHRRGHIDHRRETFNDEDEALNVQAVYASYSWLLSQACYQGFSTFTDLTYPLLTQTVITNGRLWSLYAYQMNTTLVHSTHADENPRRNLCWTTGSLKLFEKIEDGKLVGFNDDVLKELIKFYANTPQERVGVEMKPYLGTSEQKIADIKEEERRAWLEEYFKYMYSNRPRHKRREEVDHWEWIYKIKFKTRPMDKKRKKWEFGIKTSNRKYNDHWPVYIPKVFRPEDKHHRNKWAKTYYP